MKVLFKVVKLSMFIVLSSFITTWQASATPLLNYSGANTNQLVINNSQQAARLVKSKYGGKILKVQRTKVSGNPGYKVKLLKDNGHVVSIKVNAKSGRVSGK